MIEVPVLERKVWKDVRLAHLLLVGIVLLSILLHFSNLSTLGDANTYYTAAVKSMLQSWSNFFFVAAEPGGSVSVDKPPFGLWVETAFALVLGVSGFSTSLPNMIAGILSVPLLYNLVSRYAGKLAGLVAALVLVVTPIALATNRNNTMDGLLVFILLLAAWAFVQATERGRLGWLLLGAFMVGLGFNTKMLQAFLPLPAFYALYFLGARVGWLRKIMRLGIATVLMLVVSLAWPVAVDLTPAEQRPYVGSSDNNTVMELIVGHNGLSRLFNPRANNTPAQGFSIPGTTNPNGQTDQPVNPAPAAALDACANQSLGDPCSFSRPNGNTIQGNCILPPGSSALACAPQERSGINPSPGVMGDGPNASPDQPGVSAVPFSQETGSPGWERFFIFPLSKQMSWLLPFALLGLLVLVFAERLRWPPVPLHKALILWGGWLLTCLIFLSTVEGIFHAYYTIMLAPALGALVGMSADQLWRWQSDHPAARVVFVLVAAGTIGFQVFTASQYGGSAIWVYLPITMLLVGAGFSLRPSWRPHAFVLLLASVLAIPFCWTAMTAWDRMPNVNLPTASDATHAPQSPQRNEPRRAGSALLTYLEANNQDTEYLVAVPNAHLGSPLVLGSGRPVLYIGGFSGSDPVIDAEGLAGMVRAGRLRYILFGAHSQNKVISQWLASTCEVVPQFSRPGVDAPGDANQQNMILYLCE